MTYGDCDSSAYERCSSTYSASVYTDVAVATASTASNSTATPSSERAIFMAVVQQLYEQQYTLSSLSLRPLAGLYVSTAPVRTQSTQTETRHRARKEKNRTRHTNAAYPR